LDVLVESLLGDFGDCRFKGRFKPTMMGANVNKSLQVQNLFTDAAFKPT
jgi:hypothetical protein